MSTRCFAYKAFGIAVVTTFTPYSACTLAEDYLFHPPIIYKNPTGRINSIHFADIDSDSHLDLLLTTKVPTVLGPSFNSGNIHIMLGTGTGSFQNTNHTDDIIIPAYFNVDPNFLIEPELFARSITGILTTDINQDGYIDLLAKRSLSDAYDLQFLLNDHNGGFQAPSLIVSQSTLRTIIFDSMNIIDINNDEYPDLITREYAFLRVYINNGDAQFQLATEIDMRDTSSSDPRLRFSIANLNSDSHIDFLVFDFTNDNLMLLIGDGSGNLQAHPNLFSTEERASTFKTADLNNDSNIDLISAHVPSFDNFISITLGSDSLAFLPTFSVPMPRRIDYLVTADFNGDGNTDIATSHYTRRDITLFMGDGNGGFETDNPITVNLDLRVLEILTPDIDSDGNFDLVVHTPEHIVVMMNSATHLVDSDNDAVFDIFEGPCSLAFDMDSDDDGLLDGDEDANRNGIVDSSETDPCNSDTDQDGIQDGTEMGIRFGIEPLNGFDQIKATDHLIFIADADSSTTTDPLNWDSDGDKLADGQEDLNKNGKLDPGETDPLNNTNFTLPIQNEFLDENGNGSGGGSINILVIIGLLWLIIRRRLIVVT